MIITFVGLGSNLDNPTQHILSALAELASLPGTQLIAHSSLYETTPMGNKAQPNYINAVAELETLLSAPALMAELINLEQKHGRHRTTERWTSRTLDLDLLLYGEEAINLPSLTVPHPGLTQRVFVLQPLIELAPEACLPNGEKLVNYLNEMLKNQQIEIK